MNGINIDEQLVGPAVVHEAGETGVHIRRALGIIGRGGNAAAATICNALNAGIVEDELIGVVEGLVAIVARLVLEIEALQQGIGGI
ncbi:MAG: hypothetical protein DKINENOH_05417 [bacterium]|nr:hypothetical protein [bacterium]